MVFPEPCGMGPQPCHSFCGLGYRPRHVLASGVRMYGNSHGYPPPVTRHRHSPYCHLVAGNRQEVHFSSHLVCSSMAANRKSPYRLALSTHNSNRSREKLGSPRSPLGKDSPYSRRLPIYSVWPQGGLGSGMASLGRIRNGLRGVRRRRRPRLVHIQEEILHGSARGFRRDDCNSPHRPNRRKSMF